MTQSSSGAERILKVLFRLVGTSSLLAWIFVIAPRSWMEEIHLWLQLGELPEGPIVGYLARSESGLYGLLGGLFWVLSCDLPRYRKILNYLGPAVCVFGLALLGVDWWENLPLWWKLWEGPFLMAMGVAIWSLNRRLR